MHKRLNRRLLRFLEEKEEDYPDGITEKYAAFRDNMELSLKNELGSKWEEVLALWTVGEGLSNDEILMSPNLMQSFFEKALEKGKDCGTFQKLVEYIYQLRGI